jgi:hypothetical protein
VIEAYPAAVRQLDRQRRSRPLAILYVSYFFSVVHAFIVAVKIVKPGCAATRNDKGCRFIGNSWTTVVAYKMTKGDAVVECANLDHKVDTRSALRCMDPKAVEMIHRS